MNKVIYKIVLSIDDHEAKSLFFSHQHAARCCCHHPCDSPSQMGGMRNYIWERNYKANEKFFDEWIGTELSWVVKKGILDEQWSSFSSSWDLWLYAWDAVRYRAGLSLCDLKESSRFIQLAFFAPSCAISHRFSPSSAAEITSVRPLMFSSEPGMPRKRFYFTFFEKYI